MPSDRGHGTNISSRRMELLLSSRSELRWVRLSFPILSTLLLILLLLCVCVLHVCGHGRKLLRHNIQYDQPSGGIIIIMYYTPLVSFYTLFLLFGYSFYTTTTTTSTAVSCTSKSKFFMFHEERGIMYSVFDFLFFSPSGA